MKLIIEGEAKEIAELVKKIQARPKVKKGYMVIDGKICERKPFENTYTPVEKVYLEDI